MRLGVLYDELSINWRFVRLRSREVVENITQKRWHRSAHCFGLWKGVWEVIEVVVVVRCMCVYWVTKFSTCKCSEATEDALGNKEGGSGRGSRKELFSQ